MEQFYNMFAVTDHTRTIDVGGNERNWKPPRPAEVAEVHPTITLVNVDTSKE
jgi:hypothetical protein